MSTMTTMDGTEIYYKDWGSGPAVTFSHGWPLSAGTRGTASCSSWLTTAFARLPTIGEVTVDREPSEGNDMNGYADDLAALIEFLDLSDVTVVGHSTGGGEVARYIGRHGTSRVAKAALVSAVPPVMLKSAANPEGLPIDVFDEIRSGVMTDRSQYYRDLASAFYGTKGPGRAISQGFSTSFGSGACSQVRRTPTNV